MKIADNMGIIMLNLRKSNVAQFLYMPRIEAQINEDTSISFQKKASLTSAFISQDVKN